MKVTDAEIPSAFIRLDSTTHSNTRYVNVRNQQVIRQNHNVLLAQRCRRVLHSFTPVALGGTNAADGGGVIACYMSLNLYGNAVIGSAKPIYVAYIPLNGIMTQVSVDIRAGNTGAADLYIYPVIFAPGVVPYMPIGNYVTFATGTGTWDEVTATVQIPKLARLKKMGVFCLFAKGVMDGGAKGVANIADSDYMWVTTTVATGAVIGDWVYCPTNNAIQPRVVTHIEPATNKLFINEPWNILPVPGTDTLDTRSTSQLSLCALTIREKRIGGFDESPTNEYVI